MYLNLYFNHTLQQSKIKTILEENHQINGRHTEFHKTYKQIEKN